MKLVHLQLFFGLICALIALGSSSITVCHFTHSSTYNNVTPENASLMFLALFNLIPGVLKLFKTLPPIVQEFEEKPILIDNHQFEMDSGVTIYA